MMTVTDRKGSAQVTLPSDTEIVITRRFAAPPALVFKAWTTPELVKRWWGSEVAPLTQCDIDLRVGGSWRYVMRGEDGIEHAWHGTYKEVDAPARLVSTEVYEGFPDAESLNTATFAEHEGGTMLTVNVRHKSKENRDGHINSGMEAGMQQVMDRLDEVASGLPA